MKNIKDYIIKENQAESILDLKKGDVIWLCDLMTTWYNTKPSCVKATITNIEKEPLSNHSKEDLKDWYTLRMDLSDNKYGVVCYRFLCTPSTKDKWKDRKVGISSLINSKGESKNYYVGTTKEAIEDLIKNYAKEELEPILDEIAQLEKELQKLNTKKEKLEARMATKLQEIQENKQ